MSFITVIVNRKVDLKMSCVVYSSSYSVGLTLQTDEIAITSGVNPEAPGKRGGTLKKEEEHFHLSRDPSNQSVGFMVS